MTRERLEPAESDDGFEHYEDAELDWQRHETTDARGHEDRRAWSADGGLSIAYTERIRAPRLEGETPDVQESLPHGPTELAWRDNPANPDRGRYLLDVESEANLRIHLEGGRFDDRALALINPENTQYQALRSQNCAECARSVAAILNGNGRAACPMEPKQLEDSRLLLGEWSSTMGSALNRPDDLAQNFRGRAEARIGEVDSTVVDGDLRDGLDAMEAELRAAGPGAHAVVLLTWKPFEDDPSGETAAHWFNAANLDGTVVYIDAQRARRGERDSVLMQRYSRQAMGMSWIRADERHD